MLCFNSDEQAIFDRFNEGDLRKDLEGFYAALLERRVEEVEYGDPNQITSRKRAFSNCQLLQQSLLHRAERIVGTSGMMLAANNVYGLALMVRGHLEATGMLGYFCHRLDSLSAGNITFEDFEWNVADAVMGAKHQLFAEGRPPPNVLTCIEKADKYIAKHLVAGQPGMLRDCYDWLSEFARPNFLSNQAAFKLDKEKFQFVLRHGGEVQKEDFQILNYLAISSELFLHLFDSFAVRSRACLDQ